MKKLLCVTTLFCCFLQAQLTLPEAGSSLINKGVEPKLIIRNAILAKANGNTISVIDVKKKMDLVFHSAYPQLVDSLPARHQFYSQSWRHILNEMIDTELILADAVDKDLKLSDGEVREEMEERFGPNIMLTLDEIGLTYDEAWKMLKNEMIVRRMNWFYVNSKAIQIVNPQAIRQAYRDYCKENPSSEEWDYQVISIRSNDDETGNEVAREAYNLLAIESTQPNELKDKLKELQDNYAHCTIQISSDYKNNSLEISQSHKQAVEPLQVGEYTKPISQLSRFDKKMVHRIFYLKDHKKKEPSSFDEISNQLKDKLLHQAVAEESKHYIEKLRKHYGYQQENLDRNLPEDFEPFALQ